MFGSFGFIIIRSALIGKYNKGGSMAEISRTEFKGKPVLVIKRDAEDKYPFSFGLTKAKLILENLEEIKRFVEDNSKEAGE